jgi:hypothetical protein
MHPGPTHIGTNTGIPGGGRTCCAPRCLCCCGGGSAPAVTERLRSEEKVACGCTGDEAQHERSAEAAPRSERSERAAERAEVEAGRGAAWAPCVGVRVGVRSAAARLSPHAA